MQLTACLEMFFHIFRMSKVMLCKNKEETLTEILGIRKQVFNNNRSDHNLFVYRPQYGYSELKA